MNQKRLSEQHSSKKRNAGGHDTTIKARRGSVLSEGGYISEENAAYISAASPDVVLALIERVRLAEGR